eukprot:XP_016661981.1 PREDICTED: uncharacterized protein LOC107884443 [Acyrthosiphon pisum]
MDTNNSRPLLIVTFMQSSYRHAWHTWSQGTGRKNSRGCANRICSGHGQGIHTICRFQRNETPGRRVRATPGHEEDHQTRLYREGRSRSRQIDVNSTQNVTEGERWVVKGEKKHQLRLKLRTPAVLL